MIVKDAPMSLDKLLNSLCVYCGKKSEGNHYIHRDGFGKGPEVPLCDKCGAHPIPTCEQIWEKISEI